MTPDKRYEDRFFKKTPDEQKDWQPERKDWQPERKDWLRTTLTQYHQDLIDEVVEAKSRIASFAEHRATCFLYSCEDEEYQNSKCDCGLYEALTEAQTIIKSLSK